jgi:hypothetical protein
MAGWTAPVFVGTAPGPARAAFPRDRPCVSVFGSCDFHHADSATLCDAIGRGLAARLPDCMLLTGGNAIVHKTIGAGFLAGHPAGAAVASTQVPRYSV